MKQSETGEHSEEERGSVERNSVRTLPSQITDDDVIVDHWLYLNADKSDEFEKNIKRPVDEHVSKTSKDFKDKGLEKSKETERLQVLTKDNGEMKTEDSPWQGVEEQEDRLLVVLSCVLPLVGVEALRISAGVCRAWRAAVADDGLWRRVIAPTARPRVLRALHHTHQLHCELNDDRHSSWCDWNWRAEALLTCARWQRSHTVATAAGVSFAAAALDTTARKLALLRDDGSVTVWVRTDSVVNVWDDWCERWSGRASSEWRSAVSATWAPTARRLLLVGALALTDRSELILLGFNDEWEGRVLSRSEGGPSGAGACWATDEAVLTAQLKLLAPSLGCTTIWLTSATQETQSEYAGVTKPLLRIFNEAATHISNIVVAEVPADATDPCEEEEEENYFSDSPSAAYYHALRPVNTRTESSRVLVCAGGAAGGVRGRASALLAWRLPALELTEQRVTERLDERARRRRALRELANPDPPEPTADEVRALCTPPDAICQLYQLIVGLFVHPSGRCVWAGAEGGAWCVSLPGLRPLARVIPPPDATRAFASPHYLQLTVDDDLLITPMGRGSSTARVFAARSCSPAAELRGELRGEQPVLATLLLPRDSASSAAAAILLTVDSLEGARTRSLRSDCKGSKPPKCPPCPPRPPPPCRRPQPECSRAIRVVCCPPPAGRRPPCDRTPPPCPLTCENVTTKEKSKPTLTTATRKYSSKSNEEYDSCVGNLDRVAKRLKAAEKIRRAEYEKEVTMRQKLSAPEPTAYMLPADRQCLRASDGRDYTVADAMSESAHCGPCRTPPPPCPVKLISEDNCEIQRNVYADPCKHLPRVFVEIDRCQPSKPVESSPGSNLHSQSKNHTDSARTESLTTRIMGKLKRGSSSSCPRQPNEPQCGGGKARHAFDDQWCKSPPSPTPEPTKCEEPSILEKLRRRSSSSSADKCNQKRGFHSAVMLYGCGLSSKTETRKSTDVSKAQANKLDEVLKERSEYHEAGQGRIVGIDCNTKESRSQSAGNLELPVPSNAEKVRVQVSLDFDSENTKGHCSKTMVSSPSRQNIKTLCSDVKQNDNSWLSLKKLQKKFSSCRKSDDPSKKKSSSGGTCPRTPKPQPNPAARPPCAPSPYERLPQRKPDPCQPNPCTTKYQDLPSGEMLFNLN